MKLNRIQTMIGAALTAATLQIAVFASAEEQLKNHSFDGTISAVDATERTVKVKEFLLTRTFSIGDDCAFALGNRKQAALADLKRGMEVEVAFRETGGVRVANRIAQKEMSYTGSIREFVPKERQLTVERGRFTRPFRIAEDCKVTIRNDKSASLDELKVGEKVRVVYVKEDDALVALRIDESGESFVGTLQAIDASADTIKARHLLGDRKFRLADDCKIVIDNTPQGRLNDLRIGQKVAVSYEELDGVLVAHRIAIEGNGTRPEPVQVSKF